MRVLVVRAGALGDLLLLRRAIASLKHAGHQVALLAPPSGTVLLGTGPGSVDAVLPWDGIEVAHLLAGHALPSGPLETTLGTTDLVLAYSASDAVVQAFGRVRQRVIAWDPAPADGRHASWWLTGPLVGLGIEIVEEVQSETPSVSESAAVEERLPDLGRGFLALHPGSGSPRKNWPAARFADLARHWHATRSSGPWLLCLGPAEPEVPRPLREVGPFVIARDWPPRLLGALLSRAALFVGNDSGASHLAASWGAPTLALFGPTDPRVWRPVGARVRVASAPDGMEHLSLAAVLEATSTLAGAPAR